MVTVTKPPNKHAFKAFVDASAGAMGAVFAAVLLYPLDVVKTRQQVAVDDSKDKKEEDKEAKTQQLQPHVKKQRSMWALCWLIYKAEGVEGLFAGLSSKVVHTFISSFAYFYWYSFLKQATERRTGKGITTGMNLIVAALAGALNMSMTLPLEMINTRAQIQASESESESEGEDTTTDKTAPQHKSMWDLTKEIYAEDGLLSFWKGYIPSLVLVSNPSINFTIFDKLKLNVQEWKTQRAQAARLVALTAFEAFVIAAIAKAIATVLTYPIIRAKVLMQAQKKQLESKPEEASANGHHHNHHHHHHHRPLGNTMVEVLRNIAEVEGMPGLFKGCSTQLFNTVLKSALLLMTKEQIYKYTMRLLYALRRDKAALAAKA
ncbi:hypothetical protein Poli38472_000085 [Pythium oligandrum]|uniref:Uncharacterized protein n=1 Tax=Pythium oligandrum TaxID=41045 RepID=A0A8K1FIS1_PYTOL|nr:hypothetical protein Poli38472_000085 [Pythium oligandrum]|eukprot:TMW60043.1 hypothetical protein Poli38472_000085 [Pythium oligandrum]